MGDTLAVKKNNKYILQSLCACTVVYLESNPCANVVFLRTGRALCIQCVSINIEKLS